MKKLSLGSWAFSFGPFADDPVPFERTVKRLAEAGYDGVEICGFPPHITLESYPNCESRSRLTRFLADHGIGISGYVGDFTSVNPTTAGKEQKYLDLFQRNLELCVDIGSPNLRVDSVGAPGSIEDADYDAAFRRLAEVWRRAATLAAQGGVRMVWEFEPGFIFNKPSEVVAMHRQVAHPNFQILFDTAHAYMCGVAGLRQHGTRETLPGGLPEFLKKLSGSIGALHLIDSDGTLYCDETSTHRPFGEGLIDFPRLVPLLLGLRHIEWWCIDMCFCSGSWDLVETSRDYVRNLLQPAAAA